MANQAAQEAATAMSLQDLHPRIKKAYVATQPEPMQSEKEEATSAELHKSYQALLRLSGTGYQVRDHQSL